MSLDDVERAECLPLVTRICDLHVPEMLNQLDTCHFLIAPRVLADVDLPDLTVIVCSPDPNVLIYFGFLGFGFFNLKLSRV
jgi:hypothetical protein